MNFTFWCVLADGRECSIDTNNMFEAPRRARKMDAVACYCQNPATGKTFKVAI